MKECATQVGIGLIGCGARLRSLVRELVKVSDAVEVTAVFDPLPQAREAALREVGARAASCSTVEELARREDVDWVLVGSPNCHHKEHVLAAFAAGKDVFCEKPLATNLEDCLTLRHAWEESGQRFFFGFCLRYSPLYQKIHQLLTEQVIGGIVSFEFNETLNFNHGGYIMGNWRRWREMAGTHLLEKCCHDIDLANWLTGSLPVRAASFGGLNFFRPENARHMERVGQNKEGQNAYQVWPDASGTNPFSSDKTVVDNQIAILEYASGVRGAFHTNCNAGIPERRFYLLGTEGAIRADALTGKVECKRIGFDTPTRIFDCTGEGGHHGGDRKLVADLHACMVAGALPAIAVEQGIEAAIACFGIDAAMDSGTVFDLHPLWTEAGIDPAKPLEDRLGSGSAPAQ